MTDEPNEPIECDYCGSLIYPDEQDLMIDGMHEGCYEEHEAELEDDDE